MYYKFLLFLFMFILFQTLYQYFGKLNYNNILDAPTPYSYSLQDNASNNGYNISIVYDYINYFIFLILTFVLWIMISIVLKYRYKIINNNKLLQRNLVNINTIHNTTLELVWTILPGVILILIAIPSFRLLYILDEVIYPIITIKAIGRQWYWTYEYNDNNISKKYDSYLIDDSDLNIGDLRLLEVTDSIVLPILNNIRLLGTASDVIHSMGLPALSLKLDCIPGRINQTSLYINRFGKYYGVCSELCGVNHALMPIVIDATSLEYYIKWLANE